MEEEFGVLSIHDTNHSLQDPPCDLYLLPAALQDMTLSAEICEEEALQDLPVIEDGVLLSIPGVPDTRLEDAIAELKLLAKKSDHLYKSALLTFTRGLHELKVQEQRQIITGKDIPSTNNKFTRPPGLTKKRRLRVVDIYHGAKRGKRVSEHPVKKKRGQRKTKSKIDDQDHQATTVVNTLPDKLPLMRKVQWKTFREELNRLGHAANTGKSTRRTAKNSQVKLPLPPKPNKSSDGLDQDILWLGELDLNQPPE